MGDALLVHCTPELMFVNLLCQSPAIHYSNVVSESVATKTQERRFICNTVCSALSLLDRSPWR
jgi:hypothetical protein